MKIMMKVQKKKVNHYNPFLSLLQKDQIKKEIVKNLMKIRMKITWIKK